MYNGFDKMKMYFNEYIYLVYTDLYRYCFNKPDKVNIKNFLYCLLRIPGFKYSFWMRTCAFLKSKKITKYSLYIISKLILERYMFKFGISIPPETKIGAGLYIGHFGGIVITPKAIIGKNFNISQGVTIGYSSRGKSKGYPVIGDNVYIGPGAKNNRCNKYR